MAGRHSVHQVDVVAEDPVIPDDAVVGGSVPGDLDRRLAVCFDDGRRDHRRRGRWLEVGWHGDAGLAARRGFVAGPVDSRYTVTISRVRVGGAVGSNSTGGSKNERAVAVDVVAG